MKRWFKKRRQLLAELRNLERAVRDYQRLQTATVTSLAQIHTKLHEMSARLVEAESRLAADTLMLSVFGTSGRNNGG